jgi:2-polyprenyl-3-methyl-5-hydroxy-6-metoxy-1,4-benzoquinol methylase
LRGLPQVKGIGYDISDYSLQFGARVIEAFGLSDRYEFENRDILKNPPEPVDFLICQEVLEHLDNPAEFCKGLYKMVRPNGNAYITAAVTAAHSDHIYLYESPEEARTQIEDAGFTVLQEKTEGAESYDKIQPRIACFYCIKS